MALRRQKLIEARLKKHLSQEKLAEHLEVDRTSVSYWENGVTAPSLYARGQLQEFFGVDDLDVLLEITEISGKVMEVAELMPVTSTTNIQHFIVSSPTRQFWHIAHTDYPNLNDMKTALITAIKDMNMTMGDAITRRDALCELASIPMITMGKSAALKTTRYEETLRYCTAALEGCWELMRGWDLTGRQHAFDCCCTYVPLLENIAGNSSQFQKQALNLAAQYALLQTRLGWTCATPTKVAGYARNAVSLSNETGNILLQLSAHTKLTWTYLRNKNYVMGWKVMQKGEQIIKGYERQKKGLALPSGAIGNFSSSYALAQAHNGLDPDKALGLALDSEPLQGYTALTEFTGTDQYYESAKIYCLTGDPSRAMKQLGKLISTETLNPLPRVDVSKGMRLHAINHLTNALLQLPEKDMGRIINAWTTAMEGAQERRNEVMYNEAMANFAVMRTLWSDEKAIKSLMPLTSHW